jgi:hypothetical protein
MRSKHNSKNLVLSLVILAACTAVWSLDSRGKAIDSMRGGDVGSRQPGEAMWGPAGVKAALDESAHLSPTPACAQESPKPGVVSIPIVPFILEYEHATQYFVEKINDSPDYIGIEAIIRSGPSPAYEVLMTEKDGHRKVYYTNSEAKARFLAASGKVAHNTPIEYRVEESLGEKPKFHIVFKDEKARLIQWMFVPSDDLDDLSPDSKGVSRFGQPLNVMYRTLASMAGEGTNVKIANAIDLAKELPELGVPPDYRVYEGTICIDTTIAGLGSGSQTWKVESAPPVIKTGAEWVLTDEYGARRRLTVTEKRGDQLTIQEAGVDPTVSTPMTLRMKETPEGLSLSSLEFSGGSQVMRLTFLPGLNVAAVSQSGKKLTVSFQMDIAGESKAVEGIIEADRKGNLVELTGHPNSPDWAKTIVIKARLALSSTGYKIEFETTASAN